MRRVVVVGAGIAGISVAHALTVHHGHRDVVIVDPAPPLSGASDTSMECYRTWVADPAVRSLMRRSVELIEGLAASAGSHLGIHQFGYLMVTSDPTCLSAMVDDAHAASTGGAGPVRVHPGDEAYPQVSAPGPHPDVDGVDIIVDRKELRRRFPYLTETAVGAVHLRRGGWLDAGQLGVTMLERALGHGAELVTDRVTGIDVASGAVTGVSLESGRRIATDAVVNAAGAAAEEVALMTATPLGLTTVPQLKVTLRDHRGIFPRHSPVLVAADPQDLDWDDIERSALHEAGHPEALTTLPPFCHGRPEGGVDSPYVVASWPTTEAARSEPQAMDPLYPELVVRGMESLVPDLAAYRAGLPAWTVDGAACASTPDGRPVVGPGGVDGLHVMAGLGGIGIMAAMGLADLLALHLTGSQLPTHAEAFRPAASRVEPAPDR